jgi:hypothetical protein
MAKDNGPKPVSAYGLQRSASLAKQRSAPTAPVIPAPVKGAPRPSGPPSPRAGPAPRPAAPRPRPSAPSHHLWLSFFFDGTGNNLEADRGTKEHSNVARLYLAHLGDDSSAGRFRFYIPGIGTRFKDVGDPGGTTRGLGFGAGGEDRLRWAMTRLEKLWAHGNGMVNISLFGFSRGAALARAFALRIARLCERTRDGGYRLKKNQRPVRLYFLGLFDTVASVGVAASANNEPARGLAMGLLSLRRALRNRNGFEAALRNLAFGDAPGANPAPGSFDGHASWANDLSIPPMVEDCVHMVAAHEIRNSFPLDSILQGDICPPRCREMIYPGVHSDVGGGYRAGEGARSPDPGSMLSLLPLRDMRAFALRAGVPLASELYTETLKEDFGENLASKANFLKLEGTFRHYLKAAGDGGKPLGIGLLSHMKLYFHWRFYRLARNQAARSGKQDTRDQAILKVNEEKWGKEKAALKKQIDSLRDEISNHRWRGMPHEGQFKLTAEQVEHLKRATEKEDECLKLQARFDTLPGTDGKLVGNLEVYDDQLIEDARELQRLVAKRGRAKLRPHYAAILDAYEAEFVKRQGQKNPGIISFFDNYVHDSLAGFGGDATLPSDPRIVYVGGDARMQYAMNSPGRADGSHAA